MTVAHEGLAVPPLKRSRRWLAAIICALGAGLASGAGLAAPAAGEPVTAEMLAAAFPGASRAGAVTGTPPAATVYKDGEPAGYLFSTRAVTGSTGFSGKPIDILVGLGNDGRIAGAYLRRHNEPILVIGIPHQRLRDYVAAFAGLDIAAQVALAETVAPAPGMPDLISGASISSLVIRDAILRAARVVARSRGLLDGGSSGAHLDREFYAPASWQDLMADGSLVTLRLSRGALDRAFKARGAAIGAAGAATGAAADDLFIELLTGLIAPPRVGQNLLGKLAFNRLLAETGLDDHIVLVAANGLYSFKGTGYRRSGRFDRVQIVQGERTIGLIAVGYRNLERLRVAGAPELREIGLFVIPADTGFDPLATWRLELLVGRETVSGGRVYASFGLDYALPARYRLPPAGQMTAATGGAGTVFDDRTEAPPALWQRIWRERMVRVVVVSLILAALTAILVFQDAFTRNRRLYRLGRMAFLGVTLLWLGWYAGAQLSVVNVLTFVHSLLTGFSWEFFLLDPTIFILWSYVAVAMLFWGRGVFCGWLCPFGALQELLNEAARALRVPQLNLPFAVHERLWPIKYILFLGLFAVSLHSTNLAVFGAEVEPFKTAITLKFLRHWPFVAYAVGLLAAGLFVERFFCRYFCPLGAALALPARLRMFDWLKRRPQCGRECNICALHCTVQAMHPNGAINPNECIHCLNCQTLYHDETSCPPLIARRKRRDGRAALKAAQGAQGAQAEGD
jgi:transcriptional regulator of nitric oxide reductase